MSETKEKAGRSLQWVLIDEEYRQGSAGTIFISGTKVRICHKEVVLSNRTPVNAVSIRTPVNNALSERRCNALSKLR